MAAVSPLVTAKWLDEHMTAPDLRVIDATWFAPFLSPPQTGREAYDEAHIPGAVFFNIETIADTNSGFPHTMPPPHVFSSRIRKLGLGDGNRLVVYDRNGFSASARVWWMFRTMGVTEVSVLDGGLGAWIANDGVTDDLAPLPIERHFTPRVRADLIKTTAQMRTLTNSGEVQVIDARPADRFSGAAPEPRAGLAAGHIPGSRNIPSRDYLNADGTMKPAEELRALFDGSGVDASAPTVTSCGSGVTACIAALAMASIGNDQAAVYDGSWVEWASDLENPVATGGAR